MTVTDTTRQVKSARIPPEIGALEDAFARYQGELLGTLYYLVGNREDARDALQESFVKCWRHRDKVSEVRNLKAWIFRIVLNTGRDLRETAWRRRRRAMPAQEAMIDHQQTPPRARAEHNEQIASIREALRQLRPEEQEVFLLRQNGQMTYEEISQAIGIPTGTVKTRMRLALTKLRKALVNE